MAKRRSLLDKVIAGDRLKGEPKRVPSSQQLGDEAFARADFWARSAPGTPYPPPATNVPKVRDRA